MRGETRRLVVMAGACLLVLAGAAFAQQSTITETKSFEVVSVDGNKVVLRGAEGAKEITVPEDFRFNVGGKQLSVHDLKPGMKGTATITTTTTTKPVYVTEIRNGEVMRVTGSSVIVRTEKGFQSFTEGQLSKRNVQILRDGKPVKLSDLHTGDRLTANIVTEGPPQVVTEREVHANLAPGSPATPSTPKASTATASTATASEASAPATASSPAPAEGVASSAELPTTASPLPLLGLVGIASLALGSALAWRRRRE